MPFLDIEKVINQKNIASRFKLVYLAGLRAKELNSPTETTYNPPQKVPQKVTTRALTDLINHKVVFHEELHGPVIKQDNNK